MTLLKRTIFLIGALAPTAALGQDDGLNIAYLAASSQNGFNQAVYSGIEEAAGQYDNVSTEIYDGEFSAQVQFSQVEDLIESKRFDALIVTPNDTVGIANALEKATAAGIPVAATLFPVGPDLTQMQPQVDGLVTTVAANPAIGARSQAEAVVDYCEGIDPCRVVVLIGQLVFPFDNLRNDTYTEVLGEHDNIEIVATGEGNYSPQESLVAMQDILQANPDIDVVLSNADQHLMGAEIALSDAGIEVGSVYMIGAGLNQIIVDGIRDGLYDASLAQFPASIGSAALDALVRHLNGEDVSTWIDERGLRENVPAIVDKEWLDAHPDFKAEWQG